MARKVIFHEFDPAVYPRKVWIVRRATVAAIAERFNPDPEYATEFNLGDNTTVAVCLPVVQRGTNLKGILCNVLAPGKFTTGDAAHEAVHIADYIFDELGAYAQPFKEKNEPFAYLVGWAANCFNQAK